jgi:hypothetical protein
MRFRRHQASEKRMGGETGAAGSGRERPLRRVSASAAKRRRLQSQRPKVVNDFWNTALATRRSFRIRWSRVKNERRDELKSEAGPRANRAFLFLRISAVVAASRATPDARGSSGISTSRYHSETNGAGVRRSATESNAKSQKHALTLRTEELARGCHQVSRILTRPYAGAEGSFGKRRRW